MIMMMMMMMTMDDDDSAHPKKMVLRRPLQFELEFGNVGFRGEEKTGVPRKNLS